MQSEQKESTQQIGDYKDQLSISRARTKDPKGNEQQVLVQVSARITADRRSISLWPRGGGRESCALVQVLTRMIHSTVHLV